MENNTITVMSAPRSGSTFISQILKHIFKNVIGTHTYARDYEVVIFRNFLDSAISHYRVLHDKSDDFIIDDKVTLDKLISDYMVYVGYIKKYIDGGGDKLYFVYEFDIKSDDGNKYDVIFDKIEKFYGITIDEISRDRIIQDTNIKINRKRSLNIDTFHKWDKKTMIHGNHVNNGGFNLWEKHISEDLHEYCINHDILVEYDTCIKKLKYGD